VRAADEVVDAGCVTDEAMSALQTVFPGRSLMDEFLYLLAGYGMFVTVSASRREASAGSGAIVANRERTTAFSPLMRPTQSCMFVRTFDG
jgi:hypothetical protein